MVAPRCLHRYDTIVGGCCAPNADGKEAAMAVTEGRTTYRSEVPGIVVVEGAPAATARILGTGLEVWEVVRTYLELGRDWARLREAYRWIEERQLAAALAFARRHAADVLARIQEDYAYLPEDLRPETVFTWP
jgi:uncharacterized protein (DUF433 family)